MNDAVDEDHQCNVPKGLIYDEVERPYTWWENGQRHDETMTVRENYRCPECGRHYRCIHPRLGLWVAQ